MTLSLLITYFSLQMSSFDDPFHTNGTIEENWLYFTQFLVKSTKVIHNKFRIIITRVTKLEILVYVIAWMRVRYGKKLHGNGKLHEAKPSAIRAAHFSQNCTLVHVITYLSS